MTESKTKFDFNYGFVLRFYKFWRLKHGLVGGIAFGAHLYLKSDRNSAKNKKCV